jgi:hypothetical protein
MMRGFHVFNKAEKFISWNAFQESLRKSWGTISFHFCLTAICQDTISMIQHSITRKLIHLLTSFWEDLGGSGGVICREAYEETLAYAKKYWARHLACSRRDDEEILLALKRHVVDLELGFFDLVRTINWIKVRTSIISTFNK